MQPKFPRNWISLLLSLVLFNPLGNGAAARRVPQQLDAVGVAQAYLFAHQAQYGFTSADLADFVVSDQYTDAHNGVTHLYLIQRWQGIPVFNGLFNVNLDQRGQVFFVGNRWVARLGQRANTTRPTLNASAAVVQAAAALRLTLQSPLRLLHSAATADQATLFSNGGISHDNIPAALVYDLSTGQPRLAWNVTLNALDDVHWLNVRVDAVTGAVLSTNNLTVNESGAVLTQNGAPNGTPTLPAPAPLASTVITPVADGSSYAVYPWPVASPNHTTPLPPADGRLTVTQPADALGSPFGWHDTNGITGTEFITTAGNNVHAYTDVNRDNLPDANSSPSGGAGLDFIFPITLTQAPSVYSPTSVTNVFYWTNVMHDVAYRYGFTEAAGNFQFNNYGRGGLANDSLQAEAQDGLNNNGNFSTPVDGVRPRVQLGVWTYATPGRDSSLDNGVIAHEYGHGISRRLVGGPSVVTCLDNAESMDEGWSDWDALFMTMQPGEDFAVGRGFATYVLNQPTSGVGIRPAKYSTDLAVNPYTYAHLSSMVAPHGVGFIWATMLYEVNASLVARYGFNPDIYAPWHTGGNNLTMQLVLDSEKLLVCNPGLVDARDALLAADGALTGGANQCALWEAFAKRGLGYSADQGGTTDALTALTDGAAAFDLPPSCTRLVAPPPQSVCQNTNALYPVQVGGLFTAPVTMTVSGQPPATNALFNPNPVLSTPATTTLTLSNTGTASPGVYTLAIQGQNTATVTSTLAVYAGPPTAPTLLSPANGVLTTSPTLQWAAVSGAANYGVQVALDAGFSSLVYSGVITSTSTWIHLAGNTTYFWRVRANNPCGVSNYSTGFTFTTAPQYCSTPNALVSVGITATDALTVNTSGTLLDMNVFISGTHYWVGDLTFTVTHGLTNAAIVDRPAYPSMLWGCGNDDYHAELDDEGVDGPVENQCARQPALAGHPTPNTPLSRFDGLNLSGVWTLTVVDNLQPWPGVVQQWCLAPTLADFPIAGLAVTNNSPQPVFSPVNFTTTVVTGTNIAYTWNFGDGISTNAAVSPVQTHTYAMPGIYTAIVTATNNISVITATTAVSITDRAVAGLSATNSSPQNVLLSVNFTATVVTGTNVAYLWNFGDGATGSGAFTSHPYAVVGIYTATVTATNNLNALTTTTGVSITAGTVYGVALAPLAAAQTGTPGSLVTYTIHLTNTGNISDTFILSPSASIYSTTLPNSIGPLAAGAGATFVVVVQIPSTAPDQQQAVITLTATSQGNTNVTAATVLTTTALWPRVYLPQVRK